MEILPKTKGLWTYVLFIVLTLIWPWDGALAGTIRNTSATDIGGGFHHPRLIGHIYYKGRLANSNVVSGISAKVYSTALLTQQVRSCPNFKEGILMTPPLIFLMMGQPGPNAAPFVREASADMRTVVSRFGCRSVTMSRMFNNILSQFVGVTPVTNSSERLPSWGIPD